VKLPENLRSGFMNEEVEDYVYELLPKRDAVLTEMEEYAAEHKVPIIGPAVARMLALLVQISGAKRIFELGSGDPENAKRAKAYFERAGVAQPIRVETGDALTVLKNTPGEFDLIFNDIYKREYPDAAKQALPRVRRGGLFITDNTLWSGKAARKAEAGDADTRGVQELNRMVHESKDLFSVLIPLRDGVTVCRKL
jgi:caffeoyl-CoA O-methyltransferase